MVKPRALRWAHLVVVAGLLAALALLAWPPAALPRAGVPDVTLVLATIVLLATGALPEHVTALLFFLTAMLFAVAPAEVVFAGFHSTALWMVFGGLVIGIGVRRTGLAERLAGAMARRIGRRHARVVAGSVFLGMVLAFVMPSTMGRTLILMPIVLAMAEGLGYGEGSNGRAGMVLGVSFGTMLPGFAVLPATVPAMVLIGASEHLYGISPVYGGWLLLHFPVLGLLKGIVIVLLILWLFPDRDGEAGGAAGTARPAMARDERLMTILLLLALALWVTDFAHHISPAWVALGVATACLLPAIGIVPPQAFNEKLNYASLFYVAAVLGLGALVAHSGAGDLLARGALGLLQLAPGETAKTFAAVVGLSAVSAMLLTQPGVPVVMTPLAGSVAQASGLPVDSVLMMIVVGFSTVVLPYQTPPLVVAMQIGRVRMAQGNKLCLALLAVTLAVLLPLDYLWWQLLGRLG